MNKYLIQFFLYIFTQFFLYFFFSSTSQGKNIFSFSDFSSFLKSSLFTSQIYSNLLIESAEFKKIRQFRVTCVIFPLDIIPEKLQYIKIIDLFIAEVEEDRQNTRIFIVIVRSIPLLWLWQLHQCPVFVLM